MVDTDVYQLRMSAGFTTERIMELCGVHPRTVKRWDKASRCPVWFVSMCGMYAGKLSALRGTGECWEGWRVAGDHIVSPEGVTYSPYEINSIPWLWAMVADLRRELRLQNAPGTQQVLPFPTEKIG